jgi:hypothetical protein
VSVRGLTEGGLYVPGSVPWKVMQSGQFGWEKKARTAIYQSFRFPSGNE